ncbi:MAG TPA: hypothetical protein VM487_03010 [Phycisphaerae bacterium]|nr:hypothetical protein [Phycisphaerae bacterium]
MLTVRSTDPSYNSPLIGNGEFVTTIGPTGYHSGFCPQEEAVNRTLFWAGRRLRDARNANVKIPRVWREELIGPTRPLIRFGRLNRTLVVDGVTTADDDWEQTMDYERGAALSTLNHGFIREQTRSLVCLTANVAVFHTRLENRGERAAHVEFTVEYTFGDAEGYRTPDTRLYVRHHYPDDLAFGNVEGRRASDASPHARQPAVRESLSVVYEVGDELGEVHVGRYPVGEIREKEAGGQFTHRLDLAPGGAADLWFWVILSDRLKYTHFPDFERVQALVAAHERAWAGFWCSGHVEFGDADLQAVRAACLYTLRCNASPWSIPPGYLSTHWEGRTFHDEFYPFMALVSGGHLDLAERIPNHRLNTLPVALRRSGGHGAYFSWEATEDGEESAPYGHWTDERFIHGQFSEAAWRYYLHAGDADALARYYPLLRGCAEWLIYDVLVRDEAARLKTRAITDMNEGVYPVSNSIFVACATVRTLENAARAAELLGVDAAQRDKWRTLAAELRSNLPTDPTGARYAYAADAETPVSVNHLGMVFPFSFDVHGDEARETAIEAYRVYQGGDSTETNVFEMNWIWTVGLLAAQFFYRGLADEGYAVLRHALDVTGPFRAPCEHFRKDEGPYLPWFTSGAGAFVYATNAMFVQLMDEHPPTLLPALPAALRGARFTRLLASYGVYVSGEVKDGVLVALTAQSEQALVWSFRLPVHFAATARFVPGVTVSKPDALGLVQVECTLTAGVTRLT